MESLVGCTLVLPSVTGSYDPDYCRTDWMKASAAWECSAAVVAGLATGHLQPETWTWSPMIPTATVWAAVETLQAAGPETASAPVLGYYCLDFGCCSRIGHHRYYQKFHYCCQKSKDHNYLCSATMMTSSSPRFAAETVAKVAEFPVAGVVELESVAAGEAVTWVAAEVVVVAAAEVYCYDNFVDCVAAEDIPALVAGHMCSLAVDLAADIEDPSVESKVDFPYSSVDSVPEGWGTAVGTESHTDPEVAEAKTEPRPHHSWG